VRTSLVRRRPSGTVFPTSLNKSNHAPSHDHALLFYPFLPMAVSDEPVHDVVRRLHLEQIVQD